MKPSTSLPTLLLFFIFFLPTSASTSASPTANHTTLTFDSLTTTSGLGIIPNPHHHLSFASYSVLTPHSPSLKHLISPHDTNCAVSAPNAVLGSRKCESCDGASFEIADATRMKEDGLEPWFTLHSFWIKALDAPEPGTVIRVKGDRGVAEGGEVLEWEVEFPSGFYDMFEVRIEEFSKMKWDRVTRVEIVADFGIAALDWEFCVDDLVVQFFKVKMEGGGDEEEYGVEMAGAKKLWRQEM